MSKGSSGYGYMITKPARAESAHLAVIADTNRIFLALPALVWVGIESFELNYNRRTE
jgi:hypothetical protein